MKESGRESDKLNVTQFEENSCISLTYHPDSILLKIINSQLNYKYYTALIYKHENEPPDAFGSFKAIFLPSVPISLPGIQIRERVNQAP